MDVEGRSVGIPIVEFNTAYLEWVHQPFLLAGEGDTDCGSALVQGFVARPQQVDSLDVSCAAAVPPIHSVGVYPAQLSEQPPLQAGAGNAASPVQLQAAAAAVQTAGDAVSRYQAIEAKRDRGLAGGSVTASHEGALLTLDHDKLVPGLPNPEVVLKIRNLLEPQDIEACGIDPAVRAETLAPELFNRLAMRLGDRVPFERAAPT